MSNVTTAPQTVSSQVLRRRSFTLTRLHRTQSDTLAQIAILFAQLKDEQFTGTLTFDFGSGTPTSIQAVDQKTIIVSK